MSKQQAELVKYVIFNPQTRKHDEIDLEVGELLPGETIVKLFYCRRANRYVTVPGASLFTVQDDLTLTEQR